MLLEAKSSFWPCSTVESMASPSFKITVEEANLRSAFYDDHEITSLQFYFRCSMTVSTGQAFASTQRSYSSAMFEKGGQAKCLIGHLLPDTWNSSPRRIIAEKLYNAQILAIDRIVPHSLQPPDIAVSASVQA